MNGRSDLPEVDQVVVVPSRPGPLVRLTDVERERDEIDAVVDDLFGLSDQRGPGLADAVLIAGGAGAIAVGMATSAPSVVTVVGIAVVVCGCVLPLRWMWDRIDDRRASARQRSLIGDGLMLRIDHPSTRRLVASYERLIATSASLAPAPRRRVGEVAHSAIVEVASLLDGGLPTDDAEVEYIVARHVALDDLVRAVTDARVGDGESERRRALIEARRELDELTGTSSISAAADLTRELLGDSDA
jgi:hypothetical protein